MKNIVISFLFFGIVQSYFAQGESEGVLMMNADLIAQDKVPSVVKKNQGTFDSTFIYYLDTLQLPFFDEFSSNKFQQYNADYGDAGVTFDKKFRILDNVTLNPIPNNKFYTSQQTFRRIYDITTSTFTDVNFPSTAFKLGDLASYPVNYTTSNFFPPYYIYDTVGVTDESDTIWITNPEFFQDSATQFFAPINDPTKLWIEDLAYHNYRYAFEPRTLGVVTFDGLDENGFPYAIGTTITNYADVLTSKPIDLSLLNDADSVYLSFLVQAKGFGDQPEAGDSLVLEFYAKDLDQWKRVWSASGTSLSTTEFNVGHILLKNAIYFKKGFQFRFRNYGALSGSLDHFHLDYVHLRTLSGYQDTNFSDLAFVYPIGSLLKTYTAVPWEHFKNNPLGKMNDAVKIVMHNGGIIPANNQNGLLEVSYGGAPEGSYTLNGQLLAGGTAPFNYQPRTTVTSSHDVSSGYIFDVSKPGNEQNFELLATATTPTTSVNPNELRFNDTTTNTQSFSNYYSYDDGSAEAAYGTTGIQSRLAIRFDAYEADSLIGIAMHFVPSVNDVSNKLFLLSVWENNNGVPGNLLYEDDVFFPRNPEYELSRNAFTNYYFKDFKKVACPTSFFVGWRQFDADRLNIGLDKNIDRSEKTYFSINNGITWNQSTISGSVMIRPIFSTALDFGLGLNDIQRESANVIYPNPTHGNVKIKCNSAEFKGLQVFDMMGYAIGESDAPEYDFSNHSKGMYLVKMIHDHSIIKVVKN